MNRIWSAAALSVAMLFSAGVASAESSGVKHTVTPTKAAAVTPAKSKSHLHGKHKKTPPKHKSHKHKRAHHK